MPGEYDYHDTDGQVRWPMTEPTTTDSGIDLADPIELGQLLELSGDHDLFLTARMKRGLSSVLERLRTAEAALTEIQTNWTKQGKTQDLKVGRIAELEAKLAAAEQERDHYLQAGMAVETKIVENDEAFDAGYEAGIKSQTGASDPTILQLEEQVRSLTAERDALDHQAMNLGTVAEWEKRNRQLREQVERLTAELADMSHADYLGRTRLDISSDALAVRKLNGELRKQVERLTAERDMNVTWLQNRDHDVQLQKIVIGQLREQVERLTEELKERNAQK